MPFMTFGQVPFYPPIAAPIALMQPYPNPMMFDTFKPTDLSLEKSL
jgi:hypothetical protein